MAHSSASTSANVKESSKAQGPMPNTSTTPNPFTSSKTYPDIIEMLELVGADPEKRNWRGILIALLVIVIVLCLIVVAAVLVTPKDEPEFIGEPYKLEDMWNSNLQPRKFSAEWIKEKNIYVYRSREGEIMEYNAELNKTTVIMDNSTFRELNTDVYYISEDLQYVLIAYQMEPLYRHSFLAKYKIYNRKAQNPTEKLIPFPQGQDSEWRHKKLQYAGWAAKDRSLSFVYNNNLYYQADPFTTPNEVTSNGNKEVYNGISDWLYEEEILHSQVAHWWSPLNDFIAYAQFNDTNVPKYKFPYYGEGSSIYGSIDELAYPKAGDKGARVNPEVKILLIETANPRVQHRKLSPPPEFKDQECYVTSVVWQAQTSLIVTWLNRPQNISIIRVCDAFSADCHNNMVETSKDGNGWVNVPAPRFIDIGAKYLTVLPGRDGSHGYWKHIAVVTAPHGEGLGRKSFVTQGTFDVLELSGFDEEEQVVYYLSNGGDPRNRHLYEVRISGIDAAILEPRCITCENNEECQYVSASFSHSGKYYILGCLGPGIPYYTLRSTRDSREIVVEDNADVRARLETKALPRERYVEIEHPTENYKIWAKLLYPRTLNEEQIIKYPLLVHTYAGPETQRVTREFRTGWETALVSSQRTLYLTIDGRGSLGRGDKWLHEVYKQLGVKEVEDQILGASYFKDIKYVDEERIAIWGWSYGGFVTAHVLGDESDVYSCGVAVAPVTDWRYYDTAYTERYMGLSNLEDNFRGYDNANVSRKAENFKGKKFMIVHGTADDNVHFQHTAQFIKALTEADIDFRIQVYSDKNHALSGPKTSKHLYRTMLQFLQHDCWDGGRPRDPSKQRNKDVEDS